MVGEDRYLMSCMAYIDNNPVRAGVIDSATDYAWSSARHLALGVDPVVAPHEAYGLVAPDNAGRQTAYRTLLDRQADPRDLKALRRATQQNAAWGSDRFQDEIQAMLGRRLKGVPCGRLSRREDREKGSGQKGSGEKGAELAFLQSHK